MLASKVLADVKKKIRFWQIAFTVAFVLLTLSNGYWMLQILGK